MSVAKLVLIVALLSSPVVWAEGSLPPPNMGNYSVIASTACDPVFPVQMGALEITLEKTSLKKIQSEIGVGEIYNHGDASEALAWICYTISTSKPKQRVWLSSGEMGGLDVIDGITALELPATAYSSKSCPELPQQFSPLRFTNGTWLGMPEKAFIKAYGKGKKEKDVNSYVYIGKNGKYDIIGSLNVHFKNQVLVAINVNHVTSN